MTDTMAEGAASAAACMLSPRIFTSRRPSSKLHHTVQAVNLMLLRVPSSTGMLHMTTFQEVEI